MCYYHITPKLIEVVEKIIGTDCGNLILGYGNDFNVIKRIIINYCRLRIDLHSDLASENDDQEIEKYLDGLDKIEYSRLLARALEDS